MSSKRSKPTTEQRVLRQKLSADAINCFRDGCFVLLDHLEEIGQTSEASYLRQYLGEEPVQAREIVHARTAKRQMYIEGLARLLYSLAKSPYYMSRSSSKKTPNILIFSRNPRRKLHTIIPCKDPVTGEYLGQDVEFKGLDGEDVRFYIDADTIAGCMSKASSDFELKEKHPMDSALDLEDEDDEY